MIPAQIAESEEGMTGLEMRYFILKPRGFSVHAHASRMAMFAYSDAIKDENPELARELRQWASREQTNAQCTDPAALKSTESERDDPRADRQK